MENNADLWSLAQQAVASLVRHGMTALAGWLVTEGVLQANQTGSFVTVETGVVVGAIGLGWSLLQKYLAHKTHNKLVSKLNDALGVPAPESAAAGTKTVTIAP